MLLSENIMQQANVLGAGSLTENYAVLTTAGLKCYLSGNPRKARGLTPEELAGKNAEFALLVVLVELYAEADRILVC